MKTLGLIGGTGPESTIDYYRLLTNLYREKAEGASPHIIINSINLKQMIEWMGAGALDKVPDELVKQFETLECRCRLRRPHCQHTTHRLRRSQAARKPPADQHRRSNSGARPLA